MVNPAASPDTITARAYDVGFGDCLLLSIHYLAAGLADDAGRNTRHVLIDFGSTRYPYRGFKLKVVAKLIRSQIRADNGLADDATPILDALIATHRHKDHISGFDESFGGDEIAKLDPRIVIRPWPDDPNATSSTRGPLRLTDADREFAHRLTGAHAFAAVAAEEFKEDRADVPKTLHRLADIGLANANAIGNLERWARDGHPEYVAAGDVVDFNGTIPGVRFDVLGPPTLAQAPNLNSQRSNDEDEYWFRMASKLADNIAGIKSFDTDVYDRLAKPDGVGAAAWLIRKLERRSVAQLLRIVRSFDDALNNTSVVGLLRTDKTSILVSGDAQIENWQYTLDRFTPDDQRDLSDGRPVPEYDPGLRADIADVSLYKVGHHGSRNGTPISLHTLWASDERNGRNILRVVNSTKSGVHGHSATTAVPSPRLESALRALKGTRYYSTEDLRPEPTEDSDDPVRHRTLVGSTRANGRFGAFKPETEY